MPIPLYGDIYKVMIEVLSEICMSAMVLKRGRAYDMRRSYS